MILLMLGYIQDDDFDKTLILHGSNALEEHQNNDIAYDLDMKKEGNVLYVQ